MHRHSHVRIYSSRLHLLATILFILLPFVFLFLFSKVAHIASGELFLDLGVSVGRLGIAYFIAAGLGWLCAVLFYRGRRAIIALPVFDVLQSFPTFAALPLATFVWGKSTLTVILFLVITVIWPIFFSVVSSLRLARHDWEEAVEMAGLSGIDYLKLYLLPVSIPGLITGSIIGLGGDRKSTRLNSSH